MDSFIYKNKEDLKRNLYDGIINRNIQKGKKNILDYVIENKIILELNEKDRYECSQYLWQCNGIIIEMFELLVKYSIEKGKKKINN